MMMKMTDTDKVLKQLYYQPGSPASFGGARALWTAVKTSTKYKNVNIRLVDVKKWLSEQTPYLLFKNRRVNYPRNKTSRIPGLGYQMGADTWTLTRYSQYNYGMGYVYCAPNSIFTNMLLLGTFEIKVQLSEFSCTTSRVRQIFAFFRV